MSQDGGYDLTPQEKAEPAATGRSPVSSTPPPGGSTGAAPVQGSFSDDATAGGSGAEGPAGMDPDIEKNRGLAVLGYICFIVPLVAAPNSKFARFHANQALLAFLGLVGAVVGVVVLSVGWGKVGKFVTIDILNDFFSCGVNVLEIALLLGWIALLVSGIITAANGERKVLPVIGHMTLIK